MAIILTKPDTLSLASNLKKFGVSSNADVSFKLAVGDTTLIEESYSPDAFGKVEIDVSDIVIDELSFMLPTADIFVQPSICKTFTATINAEIVTFSVIRAGVENLSEIPENWLKANWLTWQPQTKSVSYYQPEWLTHYSPVASIVKIKYYLVDGTTSIITLNSAAAGSCYTYNMQFAHIMSLAAGEKYGYYDVWVENASAERLSYVQRYVYREVDSEDEFFLSENSLGGLDTEVMSGASIFVPEIEHADGTYDDVNVQLPGTVTRLYTKDTGWKTRGEAAWLWDFFTSRSRYKVVDGVITKITISESPIEDSSQESMKSYTFKYRLAVDQGLLNLSRSTDPLPENLIITTSEGLFFLEPRLADFQPSSIEDNLLFPVQSPFSQTWMTLSLGGIRETLSKGMQPKIDSAVGDLEKQIIETKLFVEYSTDAINWHSPGVAGDRYIRQKVGANGVWSDAIKVVGNDAIMVEVWSEMGNTFINGAVSTTLQAIVYKGLEEITSQIAQNMFSWKRSSTNPDGDLVWNSQHAAIGSSLVLTRDDVTRSAIFSVEVTINNETYTA